MKKIIILIVIALSTTSGLFAQKTPFEKFDKSRIDVGTLYVYEYSENNENFKPVGNKYLFIKSLNRIELMYVLADTLELPDIDAYVLNYDYMMLEKDSFNYVGDKNDIPIGDISERKVSVDFKKKIFKWIDVGGGRDEFKTSSEVEKFDFIPTYFYQITDLMPLWFALRFYPIEKERITVNSLTNGYNTELEIKFDGIEEVEVPFGKINCYKFELQYQLSFFMKLLHRPKKVTIWLTSEDSTRYMIKYKNDNEQYSVIQNMEYRLAERKKITNEEWEELKTKIIKQRLNAKKRQDIAK